MSLLYLRTLPFQPNDAGDATLVEVRFVDAQAEERAASRIVAARAEREVLHLDRARKDWIFDHCAYKGVAGECASCAVAWSTSPERVTAVVAAKAKAAAWHPLATTLGSCWRVPVGEVVAERVKPLVMIVEWPECLTDGFVPEAPAIDLCVTGTWRRPEELVLLSPLRPDGRYAGAANIALPLDYVLTHSLRVS